MAALYGDNGVSAASRAARDSLNLATLVGKFNPPWDSPQANGPTAGDAAFLEAANMVGSILARRVEGLRARMLAEAIVLAAHRAINDACLLVLETGMPWENAVFSHDLPVVFCVSPASNGNWMVDTKPHEPGSFAQRLPLPESRAGLKAEELAAASGVPDAVLCMFGVLWVPRSRGKVPLRWRARRLLSENQQTKSSGSRILFEEGRSALLRTAERCGWARSGERIALGREAPRPP